MADEDKEKKEDSDTGEQQQLPKQVWWKRIGWRYLEIILVLATITLAIFTALLWSVTHDLLVDTQTTSQQQAKDTQESLAQFKKSVEATNRLADIATKANEITYNAMVVANRPWVGTTEFIEMNNGIAIVIHNSGNSPALNVRVSTETVFAETESQGRRKLNESNGGTQSIILPNSNMHHMVINLKESELRNHLISTNQILVINGRINYTDSFGQPHYTTICKYYDVTLQRFAYCSKGNSAD